MKNFLPNQWRWLRAGFSLFAFMVFNQISAQINIAPNAVVSPVIVVQVHVQPLTIKTMGFAERNWYG